MSEALQPVIVSPACASVATWPAQRVPERIAIFAARSCRTTRQRAAALLPHVHTPAPFPGTKLMPG